MMLGVCRRPYPDELFYGYVRDVFRVNGFTSMQAIDDFIECGHIRVNSSTGLTVICDRMNNPTFPDIERAVAMTPYFAIIDTMPEGEQAKEAERMLFAESPAVPDHSWKIKNRVRICKKCWEEDKKKYGTGYLHLSHHLPGVQVCVNHACALHEVHLKGKRGLIYPLESYDWEEISVPDLRQGLLYALDALDAYDRNKYVLRRVVCDTCGKLYLEHSYSHDTLAGCPFCNQKMLAHEILQRRVDTRFPDEYEVEENVTSFSGAYVTHKACGTTKQKIDSIIYGNATYCQECQLLTPKRLQQRFDPMKQHWEFHENSDADKKRKRISVTHLDCGHTSKLFMPAFKKKEDGYCPYCDSKTTSIDISEIDPEYEILGDYKNNREPVKFRHKTCGVVFETSKTSFLAGRKCPVCTPRLDFNAIQSAVAECTDSGYVITKSKRRGFVNIKRPDGIILNQISYQIVIEDLKSNRPTFFPDRVQPYESKISVRKMIFDSVKEECVRKGYWCFADGINQEPVSRTMRNLVQDMARLGFIKRISTGRYIVEIEGDADASSDAKDS